MIRKTYAEDCCMFIPGGRWLYIWRNLGNVLFSKGIDNLKYYSVGRGRWQGHTKRKRKKKVNINFYQFRRTPVGRWLRKEQEAEEPNIRHIAGRARLNTVYTLHRYNLAEISSVYKYEKEKKNRKYIEM